MEKTTLCVHFLTFSKRTIQNFPLLSNRLMEVFVSISGGFPSQLTSGQQLFPVYKGVVNSRQTNLFNQLECFSRIGRFSEGETFYQIATTYVKVVATD